MTSATEPIHVLTDDEFRRQVSIALRQAAEHEDSFAVVVGVPKHLPPANAEDLLRFAAECVRRHVRGDDIVGKLDDGAIAIGARDTDKTEASVLAHRVRNELELQAHNLQHSIWDTGIAQLGEDGTSADSLIAVAITSARQRRRNLASSTAPIAQPDVSIRRD